MRIPAIILLALASSLLSSARVVAQTTSRSYVRTERMLDAGATTKATSVQYFDRLGRPEQRVYNGFRSDMQYAMEAQELDGADRVIRTWLPGIVGTTPSYTSSDNLLQTSSSSHAGDTEPYSITEYDALDRPESMSKPGSTWHDAGRKTTVTRSSNSAGSVIRYTASAPYSTFNGAVGFYEAGTLTSETVTDEDGRSVSTFTDLDGRKVLERRGTDNDTYFVYDQCSRLCYVLTPEYQADADLDRYAYEYHYNAKGQMTSARIPGCTATQYWYGADRRVCCEQDALLYERGLYRFYLYDVHGRVCVQGTSNVRFSPSAMVSVSYSSGSAGFQSTGYVVSGTAPSGTVTVEIVNFYDSPVIADRYASVLGHAADSLRFTGMSQTGLLTGTMQRTGEGAMMLSSFYYDGRGRLERSAVAVPGSWLSTKHTAYRFTGKIGRETFAEYTLSATGTVTGILSGSLENVYDLANPEMVHSTQLSVRKGNGAVNTQTIGTYSYDAMGRLSGNDRPGTAADMTYSYDPVQGWVREIASSGGFIQTQLREDCAGSELYSGAISAMTWKAPGTSSVIRRYDYEYDQLGRMTDAEYSETGAGSSVTNRYGENVSYDANSNITGLTRRGKRNDATYGNIDVLSITKDGNRLKKVTDSSTTRLNYYGASDFVDGANQTTEYEYYGNGALKKDLNRGISSVTYDNTGHLSSISFQNGSSTTYVYSADGQKLKTTHMSGGTAPVQTTTEYRGGLVMENGSVSRYAFPGGYVTFSGSSASWHYYVQDYQGNNRMVVNGSGNVEQVTHYYPYGGVIGDISTNEDTQKYKFLGKELDRKFGLDWYDDEARMYDAIGVPRFTTIDPLAEKYYHLSPYSYCGGDPVNSIDPTGLAPSKKEGGRMINHIYDGNIGDIVEGWKCIEIQNNKKNGLKYGIYTKSVENGEFEYALVFAGTEGDDPKDIDTDMRQVFGKMEHYEISESGILVKSQYGEALDVSKKFLSDYGSAFDKTILGHSLGGALAAVGSMETGIQAITYNPAGLHKNTIRKLGLKNAPTKQITNYINVGDGVHLANCIMPQIVMPGQAEFSCSWRSFFFGYSILGLYENHRTINF